MSATTIDSSSTQDNLTEVDARERASLLSNLAYTASLTLSDDPAAETFTSATTVTFDAAHEGSETFINIGARSIDDCTLNGKHLEPAQHRFDGNRLWLHGLRAGSNRLSVTAQCEYQHTGVGLHRLRDPVDGEVYVYTHFEPFDAHKVLACFDQPDLKAAITVTVTAPSAWRVCSNGKPLRSQVQGDATTWHFNTTPPLPPYLIAVVAGRYHVVESKHGSIPMALWCRESLATWIDAQAAEIFEITAAGLDFFESYFGLRYPFDEYNQLFVPEFNMGAMENPGCVTFNESYIHRGQASESQLQRRAETILHEMAHVHGFGDVTTMRWWGDLWLNETFATYMANLAMARSTRFTNTWVDFANSVKAVAARQDQLVTTHRIADDVPDTVAVRQNFDGITYHKGAAVMRQLAAWVGDDAFRNGVQDYFKRYRWGNANLQEFLDCLRRASGRDLTRWGQDWLQTTGMNTLRPRLGVQHGRYSSFAVEQTAIAAHPTLRAHRAGIGLYDLDSKGDLRLRRHVETDLSGPLTTIGELSGERVCDLVLVNDGDLTFAKLRFDERSMETLQRGLSRIIDPLARALCWAALWDLTRDAELPTREFVELVARHIPAESDLLLVERVTSQVRAAIDLYGDPGRRAEARQRIHVVAVEQVNRPDLGADLRLIWTRVLIGTAATSLSLDRIAGLLEGSSTIAGINVDTDLRWLIIGRLAEEGRADAAAIRGAVETDPTDIGRRRGAACLAARPLETAKQEAWVLVAEPGSPVPDDWEGIAGGELSIATMSAIMDGFNVGSVGAGGMTSRGQDPELLRPYVKRYVDALPEVWATRTIDEAEAFTEGLYPRHLVDDDAIAHIDRALEAGELPGPALRTLREGRDGSLRAQRARALDTAAAG